MAKNIRDLIADVNPREIASHIEAGNLRTWCHAWRDAAKSCLENHSEWRDTGEWEDTGADFVCSVCRTPSEYVSKYCPDCGAKMEDNL